MKKLKILILIVCCTFSYLNSGFGQLVNQPSIGLNQFSQTDPSLSTESIVVGDFSGAGLFPSAAMHVNTNYLNGLNTIPPSYGSFGEVFRTDAPDRDDLGDIYSFWRMFTGGPGLEVEHLAIFNSDSWNILPSPYNDMNFRATSGNMFLWTQGAGEITFEIS